MPIDVVIFDCDGVLVNSELVALETEIAFVERYSRFKIDPLEYAAQYTGMDEKKWMEAVYNMQDPRNAREITPDDMEDLKESIDRVINEKLDKIQGVEDFVRSVTKNKAVASNSKTDRLLETLRRTDLMKHFGKNIFSADRVESGKPDPALFVLAAAEMATDVSRCVVIEDSVNGIIAAKKAGMTVIGFTGGGHYGPSHAKTLLSHGADDILTSYAHTNMPKAIKGMLFD